MRHVYVVMLYADGSKDTTINFTIIYENTVVKQKLKSGGRQRNKIKS